MVVVGACYSNEVIDGGAYAQVEGCNVDFGFGCPAGGLIGMHTPQTKPIGVGNSQLESVGAGHLCENVTEYIVGQACQHDDITVE